MNNKIELNSIYNNLIDRLNQTINKFNITKFISSFLISLIVIILSINIFVLIEFFVNGSKEFRTSLFFTLLAISIISFVVLNFKSILSILKIKYSPNIKDISLQIGDKFPEIKDKLFNSIELYDNYINKSIENSNFGISKDLILSDLDYTNNLTKNIDFNSIIDNSNTKKLLPILLFFVVFTAGLRLNNDYSSALVRLFNYSKSYIPKAPFQLVSINKNEIFVEKGNSVKLEYKATGLAPNYIEVVVESQNSNIITNNSNKDINENNSNQQTYKVKLSNKNSYKFELPNIKEKYKVFAKAVWYDEDIKTKETNILLTVIPEIVSLDGNVRFPSYANQPEIKLSIDNADIIALRGSNTNISVSSNFEITKAKLIFEKRNDLAESSDVASDENDENNENNENEIIKAIKKISDKNDKKDSVAQNLKETQMSVSGKKANISFPVKESGNYWIEIENNQGRKNLYPVKYSILALEDEYPNIILNEPTKDLNVKDNLSVPIIVNIADDYGFKSLSLYYRLIESKYDEPSGEWEKLDITLENKDNNMTVYYVWNLKLLNITPEDKFEYYLEVADNDAFSGYKKAVTKTLNVRMVSFEETLEIAEKSQEAIQKQIETALKKSEEVRKEIQELRKDLINSKNQQELSWEQKKKAEAIAKKQEEIQKSIEQTEKDLEKSIEQMKENNVLSEETLQKYMELQELLKEVNNAEMQKMAQKMQDMMKKMSPEEMQKAIESAKFDEEMFKKSIERTKKYLEKLKLEQKTDAVKKFAEELAKRQDELMKKADENKKSDSKENESKENQELAKEQNDLKKDIEGLEKQMEDLEKQMEKADKAGEETFKEAEEEFDPEEMKKEMEEAKQNLQKNDKKSAKKNQKKAKDKLDKLADKMQKMKQELQNKMQKEIERQFNKNINDLVQLSKEQEQLNKKTQSMSNNSNNMNSAIEDQGKITQAMRNALENTAKLAEQTMAIQSETIEDMLGAIQKMEQAQQELQDRRSSNGAKSQKEAMSGVNSAAKSMQASLKDMKNGGDGSCDNPGGSGEGSSGSGGGKGMPMGSGVGQKMQQMMAQQKMVQEAMQKMMQGQQQGQGQSGEGQQSGKGKSPSQMSAEEKAEYGRLKGEQGKALKSMEELAKEQEKFKSKDPVKNDQMRKALEEMKEVMSDINSGNVDKNTFKKQERILSKLLEISKSENERDKEEKREANEGKNYMQKFNGDILSEEDKEKVIQDLLKSLKFGYSKDYEKIIKRYLNNLKNEPIKN
jgi:hypothetical protein